jgi:hypothetical protein
MLLQPIFANFFVPELKPAASDVKETKDNSGAQVRGQIGIQGLGSNKNPAHTYRSLIHWASNDALDVGKACKRLNFALRDALKVFKNGHIRAKSFSLPISFCMARRPISPYRRQNVSLVKTYQRQNVSADLKKSNT